tara:strand:+ start:131 stop:1252 length:1122 start_codon:yes stop_codon:yes gene_type:complete
MWNSTKISTKKDLINYISEKSYKKIFVITGQNSFNKSGISKIFNLSFHEKKIKFFFKNSSIPIITELKKIIKSIKIFKPDLIIAAGGGSVIDYAKMANIIKLGECNRINIIRSRLNFIKRSKLIVIPTTAGSGAEVTSNAVIYINKIKYSVESEKLIPDSFFLIPDYVWGVKKSIKSSAGFDAISQSIESIMSLKSTKESLKYAKKSLNISLKNYLDFYNKSSNFNTSAMCLAANLSGKAINISKTIAPHAVSYPFSAYYKLSHGHAVSLNLEKFLLFNFINLEKSSASFDLLLRYKILFKIFGVKNIFELCKKINFLKKQTNLIDNYKKLGINIDSNINRILGGINLLRLKNNPIKLDHSALKKILISDVNF